MKKKLAIRSQKKRFRRSLVWRPAPAREHSSEEFEPRKVIEVKEEDGYEENVEQDFDVAANDEDDEENAIEIEIEINQIFVQVQRWLKKNLKKEIKEKRKM